MMEFNETWFTILLTILSMFQFAVMVFLIIIIVGLYRRISNLDILHKTNLTLNHRMLSVTRVMFKTLVRYENNLKRWYNQSTGLQWVEDNDTKKDYADILFAIKNVTSMMHNADIANQINDSTDQYVKDQKNPVAQPQADPPTSINLEKR